MDEKDIYRTANVVMKQHGDGSALFAAQRSDALLEQGDLDGAATWKRSLNAITLLSDHSGEATPRH